tara:strand:- start:3172 stop:3453 length:282 start_codon:yes stop_codon:yes gene_type:complete
MPEDNHYPGGLNEAPTKKQILKAFDRARSPETHSMHAHSTDDVQEIADEITPDLDADSSWDEIIEMVTGMGWTEHTAQRVATYLGREQTWDNI